MSNAKKPATKTRAAKALRDARAPTTQRHASDASAPKAPQRERGRQRVAALLEAAAAVFAERGYEAATMTEIAARAGAPIGSLYQFFPGKPALADALVRRYAGRAIDELRAIEARAATFDAISLADRVLRVFADLSDERATIRLLADASPNESAAHATTFRADVLAVIASILRAHGARRGVDAAAMVVLLQMKSALRAAELVDDARRVATVRRELARMLGAYLESLVAG
jgi:AcrR family transcriptional regulator